MGRGSLCDKVGRSQKRCRKVKILPLMVMVLWMKSWAWAAAPKETAKKRPVAPPKATQTKAKLDVTVLNQIDLKYKNMDSVLISFEKQVTYALLDKVKTFQGKISIQGRHLRMETETPEKSLVVFDGTQMWLVSYLSKGFEDGVQVTKVLNSKKREQDKSWTLLSLLGRNGINKHFLPKEGGRVGDKFYYVMAPKEEQEELKKVKIVIDPKSVKIVQIYYWDSLENETKYDFSSTVFNKKFSENLFAFTPPKGAKVTVYE